MSESYIYSELIGILLGYSMSIALVALLAAYTIQSYGKSVVSCIRWLYCKAMKKETSSSPKLSALAVFVVLLPFAYCGGMFILSLIFGK